MNSVTFSKLLVIAVSLTIFGTGCVKKPKALTPIPGAATRPPLGGESTGPVVGPGPNVPNDPGPGRNTIPETGLDLPTRESRGNFDVDRETFKQSTVYFDFDSSAVKASEKPKVENVAAYLKNEPTFNLEIEGHCDERGTPEYNRALAERRALSVREFLVALGIAPGRVSTISFGEDKPAVLGGDEVAWAKNRRAEFVVLKPKAKAP